MQKVLAAILPIVFLSILFVFPVFADEDDSVTTSTTTNTATTTNSNSQTCAQGNCNACATQTISVCGNQNAYAGDCDYATACKNNPNGKYTCKSRENPNGCYFDQYDCSSCNSSVTGAGIIDSVVTTPQPRSGVTDIDKLGNLCAQDCGKCTKRYDYNLKEYTYDTCVDDKGQLNIGNQSFCKNGATKFRCFASDNNNCVSDSEGSYSYACPVGGVQPTSVPTAKPLTLASVLLDIPGVNKMTIGAKFVQNIALPFTDLTKESDLPVKFDVTYSDGSTKSFFLTFKYKPKQTVVSDVAKPTEQPKPKEPDDNKPKEQVGISFTDLEKSKDTSYDMGVLVIKYFPTNGDNIDIKVTGDIGEPYAVIRKRTDDVTNALKLALEKSTTYLGYKDPNAKPALRYNIVDTKEYKQAVPFNLITRRPLYRKIMQDHNICDYVDNRGVREVWLWAYQGPSVFPPPDPNDTNPDHKQPYLGIWESTMAGPNGFFANGGNENIPVCKKTYRVYTFNYNGGTANALESWGHQIEAEMKAVDTYLFVNKFVGSSYPGCDPNNPINLGGDTVNQRKLRCMEAKSMDYLGKPALNGIGRCGSVHNPPNARYEYDRANAIPQKSDCLDWSPDSRGSLSDISCQLWGCSDVDIISNNSALNYQIWMFQNMPGRGNTKTYQGKPLRNWWDVHGDFDNVMKNNKSLTLPLSGTRL